MKTEMTKQPDNDVESSALVLCEYFSKERKIKRWLKPKTVVEVPCTRCGYGDYAYASDAKTHICMDCSADNTENA